MKIQRFYGIDTWRAALLMFGVMVHCAEANKVEGSLSIFTLIIFMSHTFRMEAFFAVSGFLAAFALRKDPSHFIISRFRIIAIPLCVVLGVIMRPLGFAASSLHHLWFLVTLMGASWVAYSLEQAGMIDRSVNSTKSCAGGHLVCMFFVCSLSVSLACFFILKIFIDNGLISDVHGISGTIIQSPYYFIFYFAGLYIARSASVREKLRVLKLIRAGIITMCIVIFTFVSFHEQLGSIKQSVFVGLLSATIVSLSATTMVLIVIGTALSSSRPHKIIMRISAASYTIYLLHFPIIAVVNHLIRNLAFYNYEKFVILFAVTSVVSLFAHEQILQRSAMLRFLLNGRGALSETIIYKNMISRPVWLARKI